MRRALIAFLLLVAAACGSQDGSASAPPTGARTSRSPSAASPPLPPLVGQWTLNLTCKALVTALREAHAADLIPRTVGEFVPTTSSGELPSDWDPRHPCAHARPPTEHSHTFWADGTFNSYDQDGQQVDEGTYQVVDDHTFVFPPGLTMTYVVQEHGLQLDVVPPKDCTDEHVVTHYEDGQPVTCRELLAWAYSVAFPGQTWTRVTTGPHVPPGSGDAP